MNEEERISEIRARCAAASGRLSEPDMPGDTISAILILSEDVPFLLDLIESLRAQLSESQRREKAAVADMKLSNTRKFNNPCEICQNYGKQCPPVDLQSVCKNWQWRGPQDEKGEKE